MALALATFVVWIYMYWPFLMFPLTPIGQLPYTDARAEVLIKSSDIDRFEIIIWKMEALAKAGNSDAGISLLRLARHSDGGFTMSLEPGLQRWMAKNPLMVIDILDAALPSDREAIQVIHIVCVDYANAPSTAKFESAIRQRPASSPTRQIWENREEWFRKWHEQRMKALESPPSAQPD